MSNNLKKIGWIQISSHRDGGTLFGEQVRKILSKEFEVELKNLEAKHFKIRYLKPLEWVWGFMKINDKKDLWIVHSFLDLALLSLSRAKGKKLALIYHIDISVFYNPLLVQQ